MTNEEQQIIDAAAQTAAETPVETVEQKKETMIGFFSKKAKFFAIAHEIALELQLREAYTNEVLTCKVSAVGDNQIDFSELEAIVELLPITDEVLIANEFNTRIVALLECMLGKSIQPVQVLSGDAQNEIVN